MSNDLHLSEDDLILHYYRETERGDAARVESHLASCAECQQAREQLALIANTCGTTLYKAAKLRDLDQVYGQVIRDLGTVYSIGYRPANRSLDGKWRTVEVQLPQRPELLARTKRGYFAKLGTDP